MDVLNLWMVFLVLASFGLGMALGASLLLHTDATTTFTAITGVLASSLGVALVLFYKLTREKKEEGYGIRG